MFFFFVALYFLTGDFLYISIFILFPAKEELNKMRGKGIKRMMNEVGEGEANVSAETGKYTNIAPSPYSY